MSPMKRCDKEGLSILKPALWTECEAGFWSQDTSQKYGFFCVGGIESEPRLVCPNSCYLYNLIWTCLPFSQHLRALRPNAKINWLNRGSAAGSYSSFKSSLVPVYPADLFTANMDTSAFLSIVQTYPKRQSHFQFHSCNGKIVLRKQDQNKNLDISATPSQKG